MSSLKDMQCIDKGKLVSGRKRKWEALILNRRDLLGLLYMNFKIIKGMGKEARMKWLFTMCWALHYNFI